MSSTTRSPPGYTAYPESEAHRRYCEWYCSIRKGVAAAGLTTPGEIDALIKALYADASDPSTLAGMPRVVQVWGRKPGPHATFSGGPAGVRRGPASGLRQGG
jgi:hypothetical protein